LRKTRMPTRWGSVANQHDVLTMLAEAAARAEDRAALEEFAAPAAELAHRYGHRLYAAIADRALGVLARIQGRSDDARRLLQTALRSFDDLGTRWQVGRTQGEMAVLEHELGKPDEARVWMDLALASLETMQAEPDRQRLIRRLAR
jgi:hypothetical protein